VKAVITPKNWQFKLCDTGDDQPYVFLCCVQQSNVWVEGIAILMRMRVVTDSNLSLYTDYI